MRLLTRLLMPLALGLTMILSAAPPALAGNIIHIVQPGEDLYRIGLAYGLSWQAIMQANGLVSTDIYVGESLVIPVAGDASPAATPAPAEPTAAAPAPTAPAATEPAAPAPTLAAPPPTAPAPAAAATTYVIQRGDTLWLIGQRFGLTVSQLMAANNIPDPNYIYYGLVLTIPGPGAAGPAVGKVLNVAGQAQALPLDCESRSAVDWAGYFGATIGELDFLDHLPASDDPEVGFVGNARGGLGQIPPNDYGVYAGPVAALLRAYGVKARAAFGMSWDAVQAEIDAGRPVMAWVVGQVGYGTAVSYTAASTGHTMNVVPYEHTVIVIGYGPGTVTILDGGTGTIYARSQAQFMASWGALGDMAVVGN
jgi:LysM repeat protein/uncharacterized protein YvpB